jgi:hypothetical protein
MCVNAFATAGQAGRWASANIKIGDLGLPQSSVESGSWIAFSATKTWGGRAEPTNAPR